MTSHTVVRRQHRSSCRPSPRRAAFPVSAEAISYIHTDPRPSEGLWPGVREPPCSTLPGDGKGVLTSLQEWKRGRLCLAVTTQNINLLSQPTKGAACRVDVSDACVPAPNARATPQASEGLSSRPPGSLLTHTRCVPLESAQHPS